MLSHSIILDYDTGRYPFARVLAALVFKAPVLHKLHEGWQRKVGRQPTYEDNLHLRNVMQKLREDSPFYQVYHRWVAEIVSPHYAFEITYSAHPKMRVHLAGTGSVSNFHRDVDVTGRELQINCYLPFTDVWGGNTLWCETSYGRGDYQPLNLRYGQALLWDGGYLMHGTVSNKTDSSRVSCDFRFQPKFPERAAAPWSQILSGRKEGLTKTIHP